MANDVSGFWGGTYYYPEAMLLADVGFDTAPVDFDAQLHQDGHQIAGQITEENRFDPLAGSLLTAHISGHVAGPILSFEKTYISGGAAAHTIIYRGSLSGGGQEISGQWETGGQRGTFVMRRDKGTLKRTLKQTETVKV